MHNGDFPSDINEISVVIARWREQQEFDQAEHIDETQLLLSKLMLVTTEVAEAAEAVRTGDLLGFAEEMADVIIRSLDLTHGLGLDVQDEIAKKMAYNYTRPVKHGKRA